MVRHTLKPLKGVGYPGLKPLKGVSSLVCSATDQALQASFFFYIVFHVYLFLLIFFLINITWKITKNQVIIITIKLLQGKVPKCHLPQIMKVSKKFFSNKFTKTDNLSYVFINLVLSVFFKNIRK